MTEKEYGTFFDLLQKIIDGHRTWKMKKEELLSFANEADESNLEELSSWFPEE